MGRATHLDSVKRKHCGPDRFRNFIRSLLVLVMTSSGSCSLATDYFLTIGGGYDPSGNQASLEANVVFFQAVLAEKHRGERVHDVFFADGFDKTADVQILSPKTVSTTPATDLIETLYRRGRGSNVERVEYRDHVVPNVAGATNPDLIYDSILRIAKSAHKGDRLFVYVTSHGSEGKKDDPYNTTVDCWNDKEFTVRKFSGWLAELPADIPVVMVMAQCYCGGFAQTIFEDFKVPNAEKKPAKQIRVGFFAQQHNLTAAGCRPDIDNDEEFSSYFWGAIVGRSRTGQSISDRDLNRDGTTSFAEAYAYAVVAGNTIDIPLRTTDVLLRTYSRMPGDAKDPKPKRPDAESSDAEPPGTAVVHERQEPKLFDLKGTLESMLDQQSPATKEIVTGLSKQLGFSLQDDVSLVTAAYQKHRNERRSSGRDPRRRPGSGRSSSGRRELLLEVAEKWPELGDDQTWRKSALLDSENQTTLLADIEQLPAYAEFDKNRRLREEQAEGSEQSELKEVKYRRLINTLEVIILSKNLPLVASPEIVERYHAMLAIEESSL